MKRNLFCFVLDASPSMGDYRAEALKSFNDSIQSVKDVPAEFSDQKSFASVLFFSNTVNLQRSMQDVSHLKLLSENEYKPHIGNGTALRSGVDAAIKQLEYASVSNDDDVSYVIVVITDGEDNVPLQTSTMIQLSKKIAAKQALGNWTIAFMVPKGGYKNHLVATLGLEVGNVTEWETNRKGAESLGSTLRTSTTSYYNNRAVGNKKTTTFFADLKDLTVPALQKLNDVTSVVRVMLPVGDEDGQQIRDFAAGRGIMYVPGQLYYKLLKSEKVQPQKQLLLRDEGGKFLAGPSVRDILGLPQVECRLRPGDMNGYEVYVQSTSYNRKVTRGMKIVELLK